MLLTDPKFLARLESLYLLARKVIGGSLAADRRSQKKGSGILFADYIEYQYGDDYRSIDWNLYARLESLFIKLFEIEEDVSIYILIDCSRSMEQKLDYAKSIIAALGYISLCNQDNLTIYGVSDQLELIMEPSHGKGNIFPMLNALQNLKVSGKATKFNECTKVFQKRHKQSGVCVILSDFFFEDGYSEGLRYLKYSKHDIFSIQTLDPVEMKCDWKGDVNLECIESGDSKNITIGPNEKKLFEKAMHDWNEQLRKECSRHEIGHVQSLTTIPFDEVVQSILRKGGLVS